MTPLIVITCYLLLLLGLGLYAGRRARGSSSDFFLAERSIGPFLLLMSLFGTTMTAFALVGSTGESFKRGIGVYGLMASISGIIHPLIFFIIGIRLWSFGKRNGYMTQIQFFRDRLESENIGIVLFPILVGLLIPYLLIGVMASGTIINVVTAGAFPEAFADFKGGVPPALGSAVICLVVMSYVFFGGLRGTAWANAFQTVVFMIVAAVASFTLASKLGGFESASRAVIESRPEIFTRVAIGKWEFLTYLFIPLSVGMFPHLFQHWLTARSARTFRLSIIAHPICIMLVWVPCVLIGAWATSAVVGGRPVIPPNFANANAVLPIMVKKLTNPLTTGLLSAGILAAIMSSLDSQFLCLSNIFTNDIVLHYGRKRTFSERQKILIGRGFVIVVVAITYLLSLAEPRSVFVLGIWCFSGFGALFPVIFAAVYWKRLTRAGAYAGILSTAATWLYMFRDSGFGENRHYLINWLGPDRGIMPAAVMFLVCVVATVVVSLCTRPPSDACLRKFFRT
jgi:SSS family solute:Na+ symporter